MVKKHVTVRLEERTVRLLEEMAKDKRAERSAVISAILKQYAENYAERKHASRQREATQQ